jgi:hypothetical protein
VSTKFIPAVVDGTGKWTTRTCWLNGNRWTVHVVDWHDPITEWRTRHDWSLGPRARSDSLSFSLSLICAFGAIRFGTGRTLKCTALQFVLTLSWPAGHICSTYKMSLQVRWDTSNPFLLHAAIYLELSLLRETSQNAFSRATTVYIRYCVQCCVGDCWSVLLANFERVLFR